MRDNGKVRLPCNTDIGKCRWGTDLLVIKQPFIVIGLLYLFTIVVLKFDIFRSMQLQSFITSNKDSALVQITNLTSCIKMLLLVEFIL